jgi:hypothetical protein
MRCPTNVPCDECAQPKKPTLPQSAIPRAFLQAFLAMAPLHISGAATSRQFTLDPSSATAYDLSDGAQQAAYPRAPQSN